MSSPLSDGVTLDYVTVWEAAHDAVAETIARELRAPRRARAGVALVANVGLMHYIGGHRLPAEWAAARLHPFALAIRSATAADGEDDDPAAGGGGSAAARAAAAAPRLRESVWFGATAVTMLRKQRYSRGRAIALDDAARRALFALVGEPRWTYHNIDAMTAPRFDATSDGLHYDEAVNRMQAAMLLSHICTADDVREGEGR